MSTRRSDFQIVLRPEKTCADPIRALRWVLKILLRRFRMRCVSIEEVPHD